MPVFSSPDAEGLSNALRQRGGAFRGDSSGDEESGKKGGKKGGDGLPPVPRFNWTLIPCDMIPFLIEYLFSQADAMMDLSEAAFEQGNHELSKAAENWANSAYETAEEGQAALDAGDCL